MKLKEILKNSIWFGIIPKLSYVVTLIITPFITPFMTAEDYGILGIEGAYVGLFSGFSTLGLHVHLSNSYFSFGEDFAKVWRRLIFWMFMGASVWFVFSVTILFFILPSVFPYNRFFVCLLCSIPIITNINSIIAQHYYLNSLNPKPLVLRNFSISLLDNFLFFVFIYFLHMGFMGRILSTAISNILLFLLFISPLWLNLKLYPLVNKINKRVKHWFKVALPMMPHTVGHIILSNSDRIIMSFVGISVNDIGLYSHGYTFGTYVSFMIDAITGTISPLIQKTYRSNNIRQMKRLFLLLQLVTFGIVFYMGVWMPEIYSLLIKNQTLHPASFVAFFTSFSFLITPLYTILSSISFIEERTRKVLWLIFVPAILNVLLNILLIPHFGYKSAIFTTLIAYWSEMLIAIIIPYYRKIINKWIGGKKVIIFQAILSICLLVLGYVLYSSDRMVKFLISLFLLGIIVLFFLKNYKKVKNFSFEY